MDLARFSVISRPHQSFTEWRAFIEFAKTYFENRGVDHPMVVEVGIYRNEQKAFYQEFLGADYIGIDIESVNSVPDILGDSTDPKTALALQEKLGGRPIDLVFIDGHHGYTSVKSDYENYAPLTRHMVAFHDIYTPTVEVMRFWGDLLKETDKTTVEFRSPRSYMGIGVVLNENINNWVSRIRW